MCIPWLIKCEWKTCFAASDMVLHNGINGNILGRNEIVKKKSPKMVLTRNGNAIQIFLHFWFMPCFTDLIKLLCTLNDVSMDIKNIYFFFKLIF